MLEFMMSAEEKSLCDEVRIFVRDDVERRLLREMDEDKVRYPVKFFRKRQ